jgi:hypothetical protein
MSEPQKFRKKPVEVEAIFFDGTEESADDVVAWVFEHDNNAEIDSEQDVHGQMTLRIKTLEGPMTVGPDWWVIRGVKGEFYPCRSDIFEATYEPVVAQEFMDENAQQVAQVASEYRELIMRGASREEIKAWFEESSE